MELTRRAWLAALAAPALAAGDGEEGFAPLFDGKSLRGWILVHGKGRGYVVEDGVLVCPEDGGGNLYTEREYADFILRLQWRLWEGGNNGVGIRAPLEGDAAYAGMEIQILDDESPVYQKMRLRPAQYTGSIYDVVPARRGHVLRNGAWNDMEIRAEGRRIQVTLNGHRITDANLDAVTDPEVLMKHPGLQRASGHIGFLGHGARVEFRHIRIRALGGAS